jgi:hypothetical protein
MMRTVNLLVFVGPLVAGCYAARSPDQDTGAETPADDSRTVETADDGVPRDEATVVDEAADEVDTWDVPLPDGAECVTHDDCVVALHEDRCCRPDPMAVPRSEVGPDGCYHELGQPWGDPRPRCILPCEECTPITVRYYAARCDGGTCVGIEEFCAPMPAPPSAGEFWTGSEPPDGWTAYRGRVVTLRGWDRLGPDSCACEGGSCSCFDRPVQHTLDCEFVVRGATCGTRWECTGTECDHSCSPPEPVYPPLLEGYLVDSRVGGWELWPTVPPGECPPAGRNPEGAPCEMGEDAECMDGLFCIFWGDVVMGCDGTCMPEGGECAEGGPECPPDQYCQHGYCGWPGG